MADDGCCLDLSKDEAVVFFEWLSRFNNEGNHQFADQAEQRVLWDLQAMLEAKLAEPFDPKYREILASARARVRDTEE
jgi:hypothetical protein